MLGPWWAPAPRRHLSDIPPLAGYWPSLPVSAAFLERQTAWRIAPLLLSVRSLVTSGSKVFFLPGRRALSSDRDRARPRAVRGAACTAVGAWHAPGSFEARGRPGPSGFRALARAKGWGWAEGGGAIQRRLGTGRRGWAQRRQPSVKGIVLAPQSRPRAHLLGTEPLAPCCARASSCGTSAHRRARASLRRSPHPRPALEERGRPQQCPLITSSLHKPPPAPFSKPMALRQPIPARSGGTGPSLSRVRAAIKGPTRHPRLHPGIRTVPETKHSSRARALRSWPRWVGPLTWVA